MPAPTTIPEFIDLVRKSGVVDDKRLDAHLEKLRAEGQLPAAPNKLAELLVRDGLLTHFQADQLAQGKWRRFSIGKYRILEKLGSGGMGNVFLCEHKFMRRRVAVKVLPTAKAADPSSLERFYREARAVAALDHDNIVHAYDIDQDDTLHFIVMEYVDGPSLQEIVRRGGPVSVERACHYISQAAQALTHANHVGLVHRDIKPGNVLVDRAGVVKLLDMGLARFFNDEEDMLTRKYDENVLGTADYLAPEQADDSHEVDIRADIYSLGGTFYFLLTGRTPFGEGTVPQKLMWHRTRQPKPLSTYRNDVPAEVQAIIEKMMAKELEKRFQLPGEISVALSPWTQTAIGPPAENEMPRLSPAAAGMSMSASLPAVPTTSGPGSGGGKKSWNLPPTPPKPPANDELAGPKTVRVVSTATAENRMPVTPPPRPGRSGPSILDPDTTPRAASAVDTAEHAAAKIDTPLQPALKPRVAKKTAPWWEQLPGGAVVLARLKVDRQLQVLVAGAAVAVLGVGVLAAVLLYLAFRTPPAASLTVGKGANFASVHEALAKARSGDKIVLMDRDHRECLHWQRGNVSGIVIQPAQGVEVTWMAGTDSSAATALLQLQNTPGLRVVGIRFNGEGRSQDLVHVSGHCPGLILEDVTLEGFTQSAIVISNCTGSREAPVRLRGIVTSTGGKLANTAILFDAKPVIPPSNEYITVGNSALRSTRLEGTFDHGPIRFKKERSSTIMVP